MSQVITQTELDELLAGMTGSAAAARTTVSQYDFRETIRLSPQDLRATQDAMEEFCVKAGHALSGFIGRGVLISLRHIEQTTCRDFLANVPEPPILGALSCAGVLGHMLWELEPAPAYAMMECVTGGEGVAVAPTRPASDIELALFSRLIREAAIGLKAAWPELADRAVEVAAMHTTPAAADLIGLQEHVVEVQMKVSVVESEGGMSLCLPGALVRRLLGRETDGGERSDEASLAPALRRVPLQIVARLGEGEKSLSEVARFKPGDIILLDRPLDEPLEILVHGSPKLLGVAGASRGRLAVQVTGRVGDHE